MKGSSRLLIVAAAAIVPLVFAIAAYAGAFDTNFGTGALASPGGGSNYNAAFGYFALNANSNGSGNTAVGFDSLLVNTNGSDNTALGKSALASNTLGQENTAVGESALGSNVSSSNNTAVGTAALFSATGADNTAVGLSALQNTTTGTSNVGVGKNVLLANTTGGSNVAVGPGALGLTTTGGSNVAVGSNAGVGPNGNTTGSANTFLGVEAGTGTDTQISSATAIGANAVVSQSNSVVLGAPNANVGIGIEAPKSKLQIGTGVTGTYGDYLQLPVVASTSPPPSTDCGSTVDVGRLVVQQKGKKLTLWGCSSLLKWVKL